MHPYNISITPAAHRVSPEVIVSRATPSLRVSEGVARETTEEKKLDSQAKNYVQT